MGQLGEFRVIHRGADEAGFSWCRSPISQRFCLPAITKPSVKKHILQTSKQTCFAGLKNPDD